MKVYVYTFADKDDNDKYFTTQDAREATRYAQEHRLKLIENTYVWEDNELIADYTEQATCSDCGGDLDDDDEYCPHCSPAYFNQEEEEEVN